MTDTPEIPAETETSVAEDGVQEIKKVISRSPRSRETRDAFTRPDTWSPPSVLPDPPPASGWEYRWIRVSSFGEADVRNVSNKMRQGWEPVRAEDYPELCVLSDRDTSFEGNIVIGGLMLCKNTKELVEQRRGHYKQTTRNQIQSVDNNWMRENDPRMPLLKPERQTRVTFGSGGSGNT